MGTITGLNAAQEDLLQRLRKKFTVTKKEVRVNFFARGADNDEVLRMHDLLPLIARELHAQLRRDGLQFDVLTCLSCTGHLFAQALQTEIAKRDQYLVPNKSFEQAAARIWPKKLPREKALVVDLSDDWSECDRQKIKRLESAGYDLSFLVLLQDEQLDHDEKVCSLFTRETVARYFDVELKRSEAEVLEALR
ncbi:MAG: hypothetical protein AAB449_01575 [Patescibacteria group bacterium]